MPFLQALMRVSFGFPASRVPQHNRSAAIFAFRNCSFEGAVGKRVIFGMNGEAFIGGIEAGALCYRPAEEDAVELEAKIVVQSRGVMLLNQVRESWPRGWFARGWLRRPFEITLSSVFFESHC